MRNNLGVGAVGRRVHVSAVGLELEPKEALELAALLAAAAAPMRRDGVEELLKMIAEAAEGTDLGKAALSALEDT